MEQNSHSREKFLASLEEIITQIRHVDQEAHLEYRWYEPWDIILNDVLQICTSRHELSVAPQFRVGREAFKRMYYLQLSFILISVTDDG